MVNTEKQVMVSRSLRLRPDTLKVLEAEAIQMGKGITVHIRDILEGHVATNVLLKDLVAASNTFELRAQIV